jgi:hypothetical protein
VSVSSRIHNNTLTSSEIKPLSKNSLKRRYERKLFERRPELNGPMMRRKRGYEKPVEKCGLFFGNRQGSIDCSPSAAPVTQDETTAITGQPSSVMTAPPAEPYIGNYSRRLVEPFTVISDSQITSLRPQFLRVPSRPPLELCEDPKASCEAPPSSQCGTQAESSNLRGTNLALHSWARRSGPVVRQARASTTRQQVGASRDWLSRRPGRRLGNPHLGAIFGI